MSQAGDIDLGVLARPAETTPPPRRRWAWSLIPLLLLAGFGWILWDQTRDLFSEAVPVRVLRPRAVTAGAGGAVPGALVFQASGWVEPDPFPTQVTALAEGVVAEMLVQEGDPVKRGQVVCRLIADDAQLAVQQAEADLARARAELGVAEVEAQNAAEVFDAGIETEFELGAAKALRAARRAEIDRRRAATAEAQAAVDIAVADLGTQKFRFS